MADHTFPSLFQIKKNGMIKMKDLVEIGKENLFKVQCYTSLDCPLYQNVMLWGKYDEYQ